MMKCGEDRRRIASATDPEGFVAKFAKPSDKLSVLGNERIDDQF
jgi:hypothetical protein